MGLRLCVEGGRKIYAELIIDEIELSLGSSTEKQHKQNGTFRIYPNPTNGMVNMDFPKGQALKIVRVYNSEAKLLKVSENTNAIDLTGLPSGAYLLSIQTDDGTIVTRLIQKK